MTSTEHPTTEPVPLTRYERRLLAPEAGVLGLRFARASQTVRQSCAARDPARPDLYAVATGVAAPLLVSYVGWVLDRAVDQGVRRLCFVSRDGQVMLRIARQLAPALGFDLRLDYLYGSRQAWNQPAIFELNDHDLHWLLGRGRFVTPRQVLTRTALLEHEVWEAFDRLGLPEPAWNAPLEDAAIDGLAKLLTGAFRQRILDRAAASRALMLRYLAQEGLLGAEDWAVVDSGWFARGHRALSSVLRSAGAPAARGFYMAQLQAPWPDAGVCETWASDLLRTIPYQASLVEMFCQADHATVVGYARHTDGRIGPLRQSAAAAPPAEACPLQAALEAVATQLAPTWANRPEQDLRPVLADLLASFWLRPSRGEAEVWGPLTEPAARPYAWTDVPAALGCGHLPHLPDTPWRAGCYALSSRPLQLTLQLAAACGRPLRSWRRSP